MITHPMGSVPHDTDVLMFDILEDEWRIGHVRPLLEGVEPFYVACTVAEAADMVACDNPVPVFMEVIQWAPLPPKPGAM